MTVVPGKNFGINAYSIDGEWLIYWKGVNKFRKDYVYYFSRMSNETINNPSVTL